MSKTKIERERLRNWAERLEALKPTKTAQFDMNDWFYTLFEENYTTTESEPKSCGFAACAVGWLPYMFPKAFGSIAKERWPVPESEQVMTYFGLSAREFAEIAYPDTYSSYPKITPKHVAQKIRGILKGQIPEVQDSQDQ